MQGCFVTQPRLSKKGSTSVSLTGLNHVILFGWLPCAQRSSGHILEVLPTENVRVQQDLIEAALAMPAELATHLVDKIKVWIPTPYRMLLHLKMGKLMVHLAKGGQTDAALDLARALLQILPPIPTANEGLENSPTSRFEEPKAHFDTWEYGQIIEQDFPVLIHTAQIKAFDLICDLLERATTIHVGQQSTDSSEDYSTTWRPLLHDHEAHGRELLRDILISGVVNSATQLAKSDPNHVRSLVERLEARHWLIFHRIALDLLKLFPDDVLDIISLKADR